MTYVLIRDCDFEQKAATVYVVGQHPDINRLRQIRTFSADGLTSMSLEQVVLLEIEKASLIQIDDDSQPSFPAKIYKR